MDPSFLRVRFDWLLDSAEENSSFGPGDGDLEQQSLHFKPELGQGHYDHYNLAMGMHLYRSTHRWLPAASGLLVPIGELDIDYGGPAFVVQSLRGGRVCQQERMPECNLIFEEGRDLFLHIHKRKVIPLVEGSSDSTMVALVTQTTTLQALLGEGEAAALLEGLGLATLPSLAVCAMPRQVSGLLHHAMAKSLSGPIQKLHAQAKLLEYLSGLAEHLCVHDAIQVQPKPVRANVATCHDYLLALDGKLPSLVSLGQMFQIPVKRLNAEFKDTYGQSIYTFFMNLRLDQARRALLQTDVPMKQLAHRLGYSHVNNFIAAFRNQFGQSPGALRRGGGKEWERIL